MGSWSLNSVSLVGGSSYEILGHPSRSMQSLPDRILLDILGWTTSFVRLTTPIERGYPIT